MAETFCFADGWLLVSIWGAFGPCDFSKLERLSDFFNHSILSAQEVCDGIVRLSTAGLAGRNEEGLFYVTDKGKAYVEQRWNKTEGHIELFLRLAREMDGMPVTSI